MKTFCQAGSLSRREMLKAALLGATSGALTAGAAEGAALPSAQAGAAQEFQVGKEPGKHEALESFKHDLKNSTGWVGETGSAKEVSLEEFPIFKSIAGVSMRLKPGALRHSRLTPVNEVRAGCSAGSRTLAQQSCCHSTSRAEDRGATLKP